MALDARVASQVRPLRPEESSTTWSAPAQVARPGRSQGPDTSSTFGKLVLSCLPACCFSKGLLLLSETQRTANGLHLAPAARQNVEIPLTQDATKARICWFWTCAHPRCLDGAVMKVLEEALQVAKTEDCAMANSSAQNFCSDIWVKDAACTKRLSLLQGGLRACTEGFDGTGAAAEKQLLVS